MADRVTVLMVQSGRPGDLPDLAEEERLIRQALASTRYGGVVDLVPVPAARPEDMISAVQRHEPSMVHLSGRGTAEDGFLFRADDGGQVPINQHALCDLLAVAAPRLVLALVNACYGTELVQGLSTTIGCAIGMTTIVDDETARRFSEEFYQAMGNGFSVRQCFDIARHALATYEIPDYEAPAIFERDGAHADNLFVIPGRLMPAPRRDVPAKPTMPPIAALRRKYRAVITGDARDEEEARSMMAAFTVEMMSFDDDQP